MAIAPDFLSDWIRRNGPHLFHRCGEPMRVWEIATVGLRPATETDTTRAWKNPAHRPRPGHVYLGTAGTAVRLRGRTDEQLLAVDLRCLDPQLINPDEDAFWSQSGDPDDAPIPTEPLGLKDPHLTVRDHDTLAAELELFTAEQIDARPYGSYGEWADANRLGSDPEHARFSLEDYGAIAVRGGVPAHALSVVTIGFCGDGYTATPATPWPVAQIWLDRYTMAVAA